MIKRFINTKFYDELFHPNRQAFLLRWWYCQWTCLPQPYGNYQCQWSLYQVQRLGICQMARRKSCSWNWEIKNSAKYDLAQCKLFSDWRNSMLEWTVPILKIMNMKRNQWDTITSWTEANWKKSKDIVEVESLLNSQLFSIILVEISFQWVNILSPSVLKLEICIQLPTW